jgi:hypothetical protein
MVTDNKIKKGNDMNWILDLNMQDVLFNKYCSSSVTATPLWVMLSTNCPRSQHKGISQEK